MELNIPFNPKQPLDARNQTIFMMLLDTGLRIGEIVKLKIDDLHLDEGIFKVLGKGKERALCSYGKQLPESIAAIALPLSAKAK